MLKYYKLLMFDYNEMMINHRAGKDATEDFEDVGHSVTAKAMMDEYYVGDIDASTIPKRKPNVPIKKGSHNPNKTAELFIKILQFLVPIVILGLAIAVRIFTKAKEPI